MKDKIGQVLKVAIQSLAEHPDGRDGILMIIVCIAIVHLATTPETQTMGMVIVFMIYLLSRLL